MANLEHRQPCIDAVYERIRQSRHIGKPVWLSRVVHEILAEYPDCGVTEAELAEIVRDLVIEQRWSLDSS
jgi:hypothetical protein